MSEAKKREVGLPHDSQQRKETPVFSGFQAYFPDAIAEVAKVSWVGNQKHNPGQPLHWAREKSTDQMDAAARHMADYSKGVRLSAEGYVLAQAAWRLLAQLQLDIEKENNNG